MVVPRSLARPQGAPPQTRVKVPDLRATQTIAQNRLGCPTAHYPHRVLGLMAGCLPACIPPDPRHRRRIPCRPSSLDFLAFSHCFDNILSPHTGVSPYQSTSRCAVRLPPSPATSSAAPPPVPAFSSSARHSLAIASRVHLNTKQSAIRDDA